MKKTKVKWKVLAVLIVVGLVLLVSITFDMNFQLNSDGMFKAKSSCYDTDGGVNFTKIGSVSIFHGRDLYASHLDECSEGKLLEYYCNENVNDKYGVIVKECNCIDGRCVG